MASFAICAPSSNADTFNQFTGKDGDTATACRANSFPFLINWPCSIDQFQTAAQLNNRNLLSVVKGVLAQTSMPPDKLQLEIAVTVLLQETFATLATLHELRKLGARVALDDFGNGYSSLSYLHSFPFDKIKIDHSFVQDLPNGSEPVAIVQAVANLTNASREPLSRRCGARRSPAPRSGRAERPDKAPW